MGRGGWGTTLEYLGWGCEEREEITAGRLGIPKEHFQREMAETHLNDVGKEPVEEEHQILGRQVGTPALGKKRGDSSISVQMKQETKSNQSLQSKRWHPSQEVCAGETRSRGTLRRFWM